MLRAIKDGILDGNITSYLLLNIVRVYASVCNNSARYNRDTVDFWWLFKIMGIYFVWVIKENPSLLLKEIIHTISTSVSDEFCRTFWTTLKKKSLNIELKYKSPNQFLVECICVHERRSWGAVVTWLKKYWQLAYVLMVKIIFRGLTDPLRLKNENNDLRRKEAMGNFQ